MVQEILEELDANWDAPIGVRHEYHMEQLEMAINAPYTYNHHNVLAVLFSEC